MKSRPQRQAGEDLPEREDVGEGVVVADQFLPCPITGDVGGMLQLRLAVGDFEIRVFRAGFVVGGHASVADDVERAGDWLLKFFDAREVRGRRDRGAVATQHTGFIDGEGRESVQRSDERLFMPCGHLAKKRQHRGQHIVGLEANAFATL